MTLDLPGAATLDVDGRLIRVVGSVSFAGAATFVADGSSIAMRLTRSLTMPGAATLTASGTVQTVRRSRAITLAGQGTLNASGVARGRPSRTLNLAGQGTLVAGGSLPGWKGVQQRVTGLPNSLHTFQVLARAASPGARVRVETETDTAVITQTQADLGTSWTAVAVSGTPTGGALTVRVLVSPGHTADIDCAQIDQGATAAPFRMHVNDQGERYSYAIARDLDGSGANTWAMGDGVFNTGRAGDGFIDLYSMASVTDTPLRAIFSFQNSGGAPFETGTYSENYAGLSEWPLWDRTNQHDAIYFGAGAPWSALHLTLVRPLSLTSGSLVYEYWNGTGWANLGQSAPSLTLNAVAWSATWTPQGNWTQKAINGVSAFWIRIRWSTAGSNVVTPLQGRRRASQGRRQYGPTIAGNVRNSTTFSDWTEHWAVGNLSGLYDYGQDVYGAAFGRYSPTTAWTSIDPSNGMRIMYGDVQRARYSDTILLGQVAAGEMNTLISPGEFRLRLNTQSLLFSNGTQLSLIQPGDPTTSLTVTAQQLSFTRSGTQIARFGADAVLFDPTDTSSFLQLTSSQIRLHANGSRRMWVTGNTLRLGENTVNWATTRIVMNMATATIGEAGESLASGAVLLGRNASGQANLLYNPNTGRLAFRSGTTTNMSIDGSTGNIFFTNGVVNFAGSNVRVDPQGLRLGIAGTVGDITNAGGTIRWEDVSLPLGNVTHIGSSVTFLGLNPLITTQLMAGLTSASIGRIELIANNASNVTTTRVAGIYIQGRQLASTPEFILDAGVAQSVTNTVRIRGFLQLDNPISSFTRVQAGFAAEGTVNSWLSSTPSWSPVWRVGNTVIADASTNMIELVPHSWGDGASIIFNGYSVGQDNGLFAVGNIRRSHAHGGGGTHAAPALIHYDGNARRWLFNIDTALSGLSGSNAVWESILAMGLTGAVFGGNSITADQRVRIISHANTTTAFPLAVVQTNNATSLMFIRGDGQAWVNQAWTIGSDAALKQDIAAFEDDPVALIDSIPVRRYRRRNQPDGPTEIGVIAQELDALGGTLRDLVSLSGSSPEEQVRGVDYTSLSMITIAAVQQLIKRVEALERRFV